MTNLTSIRRGVTVALTLIVLAACDSDSTGPGAQATLVIRNVSSQPIQMVQIAKCSDEFWGSNRLGPNETMAPGATRSWKVEPGCWDLRLTTSSIDEAWFDIELQAGGSIQLDLTDESAASSAVTGMTGHARR